jgi:hypothetical protein
MGDGINEIRVKMESGLQMALSRVDQMETLLWQERGKSKKYLALLKELVDAEDLDVLLQDDEPNNDENAEMDLVFKTKDAAETNNGEE